jgi:5'-3' exonuclease
MVTLLIDGDVLCYQACKPRWERKAKVQDGHLLTPLDESGKIIRPEYTIEEDTQYLQESWKALKKDLQELQDKFFTNDYLMAVKGPNNFRNIMYCDYKISRNKDPQIANKFVPTLRKLCVRDGLAIESEGREADDLLRIWAEECRRAGTDYIVCTIDKDLKMIPGSFYNMKQKELIEISEEEAMRHYYEQLLKGDPVDDIPGLRGVGNVKAKKLLADCKEESEFQEIVVGMYIRHYGDNWYDMLLSNGKMIYLQKHSEDYFVLRDWPIVKELI